MGQTPYSKLTILIICFVILGFLVNFRSSTKEFKKKVSLSQVFRHINGWRDGHLIEFEKKIIDSLKLDDYINVNFTKGNQGLSLFIGYYWSSKKVGATHSPLVCFPGQGWTIVNSKDKTIDIEGEDLHLKSMVVTRGQRKEIVLYWFQAYNKTSPGTFLQKVFTLWSKLRYNKEDNAFVRISISVTNESMDKAYNTGIEFIEAFYPRFLNYLESS